MKPYLRHVAIIVVAMLLLGYVGGVFATPSVFPAGTTIFDPVKTFSGYTIVDAADKNGAVLLDMNSNALRQQCPATVQWQYADQ